MEAGRKDRWGRPIRPLAGPIGQPQMQAQKPSPRLPNNKLRQQAEAAALRGTNHG